MERKLSRNEFITLANQYEDIKRKRKALREWQQKQDIQAVESGGTYRVGKRMNVI